MNPPRTTVRRCPACGGTILRPLGIIPAGTPTPTGYYPAADGGEMAECERCGAWVGVPPHLSFAWPDADADADAS